MLSRFCSTHGVVGRAAPPGRRVRRVTKRPPAPRPLLRPRRLPTKAVVNTKRDLTVHKKCLQTFLLMWLFALAIGALAVACADSASDAPEENLPDAATDKPSSPADAADSSKPTDGAAPEADAKADAGPPLEGIAKARATADGTGLTIAIKGAMVTFLKPQIGSLTDDPAGFTVQVEPTGPALFVTVDPATLTPPAAVGDTVSFTITAMSTVGGQRRAKAITGYTRSATGAAVATLIQTVTAKTDLLTNQADYDSELITLTGTIGAPFAASGQGFQAAQLDTTGIKATPTFQFRAPSTLVTSLDVAPGCTVAVHGVPLSMFNTTVKRTQIVTYSAADVTVSACPAPTVASATALSGTSVVFTFTRNIAPASVSADGSQFTFDNGLTATAATVLGRTVTVTTSAQVAGAAYLGTVASSVTDLAGSALAAPTTAAFTGFVTPATVIINELNANVTGGCDLVELRVTSSGSMTGFKLYERTAAVFTFPAFTVTTNDIIVVHFNSGSATCNPNGATQETLSTTGEPLATYARNYDTAYDFWIADAGLTATDNVITLYDAAAVIHDAVFVCDDPAGATAAADTETQAAAVGAANQWLPKLATYVDTVFRTNAADDLNGTGTAATGTSIQRVNDTDTNAKGDWTTGAGEANTFGLLNVGQNPL
jgi:hypothetical protein